jgi:hypothetical protein
MGNIFDEDFREFIIALNENEVEYILVGVFSVILHGYSRTTGNLDIWVNKTSANYQKLQLAFLKFGMPLFDMTSENFLNHPSWNVFTFGRSPIAIDIMTAVKGLDFDETFERAKIFEEQSLKIRTIHKNDLIKAKQASNRPKDQDDIANIL